MEFSVEGSIVGARIAGASEWFWPTDGRYHGDDAGSSEAGAGHSKTTMPRRANGKQVVTVA
jgi:hypothetical protein